MVVRGVNLLLLGAIIAMMMTVSACTHAPAFSDDQPRVPNEYLVKVAPDEGDRVISTHYGRFGIKYLHALEEQTFLLILSNDPGPQKMEALAQGDPRIKFVQPNLIYWDYR